MTPQDASANISVNAAQRIEAAIFELKELMMVGFSTMNDRFDRLELHIDRLEMLQAETNAQLTTLEAAQRETNARLGVLEIRMTDQESAQREANVRLARIEGSSQALYNDIKALYREISQLKKKYEPALARNQELANRVRKVEVFAKEVALQTGIPYEG
ncbi:MAG: hypothetical protein JWL89_109 [Candidatus Saccharibacteria bacterium]|nr:hypothetical protein [Candidatus Saccharibacteria bacterium]